MNNKNRLKAFILILLCVLINRSQASTETNSSSKYLQLHSEEKVMKRAVDEGIEFSLSVGTTLGIGALAIATANKYDLINRYLKLRNAENLNSPRIDAELLALHMAPAAIPALSFWAIQKAYKSQPVSSWRKRFWKYWYNKKPKQQLKK